MRSCAVRPKPSAVGPALDRSSRKLSTTPFGRALVPEVNRITALSSAPASACGVARLAAIHRGEKAVAAPVVPGAERQARRGHGLEHVVEAKPLLAQHQARLERRQDVVELVAVHLDMDGADRRAIGEHAEIGRQMLDRIVGEQRDAIVGADALVAQIASRSGRSRRATGRSSASGLVGRHDERLVRIARGGAVDPVAQHLWSRSFATGSSPAPLYFES